MAKIDICEDFVRYADNFITCEHCGAKRHFLTYKVGDISFKHYEICDCTDKRHQESYQKYIGVFYDSLREHCFNNLGYKNYRLENFKPDTEQRDAYNYILKFKDSFIKQPKCTKSVILSGGTGCGKTHLVCGALNALIEKIVPDETIKFRLERGMFGMAKAESCPYKYYQSVDLMTKLCQNNFSGDDSFIKKLTVAPLLAIDDLGCEMASERFKSSLLYVLDGRIVTKKPVLISTNLLPDEIHKKYGSRIYDRLKGMCDFITICAKSKR